jgi:GH24 family phage-related lysozyme (muramidase)
MQISNKGLDLIKFYEGLELEAYKCAAGVLTIGYGWTHDVKEGDTITEERAEELLREGIVQYENAVHDLVDVPLEQHQFDALVSWVYNLGKANLAASTLLKKVNAQEFDEVPDQIRRWNKAGGKVLEGLTKRRESEAKLWSTGEF